MRNFFLSTLVMLSLSLQAQLNESHYIVYNTKTAQVTTLDAIVSDMAGYDVLFFGEEHNDSVGHYLEIQLFERMHKQYGDACALSMEMFDRDVQHIMDEYLSGGIKEKHFKKDARVWSNYRDYRPMIEYAKMNRIPVVCANAAGRYSNIAVRAGMDSLMALPASSKQYMAPLPYDTATGAYYKKLMGVMNHGDTTAPPVAMAGFNLVMGQSLWDATMAFSIAQYMKANKGDKVMQVNGRFHSDEHFAVVQQLAKYRPKAKALVISSGSDANFPNINWDDHKANGDYIIITDPNVPKTFEDGF